MPGAVDTNILIDILEPDPAFGQGLRDALKSCLQKGSFFACEVVWAEVVSKKESPDTAAHLFGNINPVKSPIHDLISLLRSHHRLHKGVLLVRKNRLTLRSFSV